MGLPELIEQHRGEIVQRWVERAYREIAPRAVPRADVLDEMAQLIDALVRAIRRDVIEGQASTAPPTAVASSHGRQRFHVGYDISAMVREHLVLREVIFEVVAEHGYHADLHQVGSVDKFLFAALADAAGAYAIERDREVSEQAERYIGFLAHELRNPLGTARFAVSHLTERGQLPDTRAVQSLERSLAKMHELLDGALTDFATRQAPRPERTRFELGGLVRELVAETAAEAESKDVTTSVVIAGPLEVRADARLLRSAVSNLVRNSIKFSRQGSTVQIEARRADGRVSIEVTDGCGGLPPGSVERLFNPFVQAGADRTGFGLGLAIVKQVADAHDGAVRVHDVPGRGCVFVLDLPDPAA